MTSPGKTIPNGPLASVPIPTKPYKAKYQSGMGQKTAIKGVEKNQAESYEKTHRHIDARAQGLIAVNHRRGENRASKQTDFAAVQFPAEKVNEQDTERSVKRRRKSNRGLVQFPGDRGNQRRRPMKQRRL